MYLLSLDLFFYSPANTGGLSPCRPSAAGSVAATALRLQGIQGRRTPVLLISRPTDPWLSLSFARSLPRSLPPAHASPPSHFPLSGQVSATSMAACPKIEAAFGCVARTHARTHAHARARARAHTHTHTHMGPDNVCVCLSLCLCVCVSVSVSVPVSVCNR
jgi:hypothetical protein